MSTPFPAAPGGIAIVGGGLAGCECALYLARHGLDVALYEQKPAQRSPAHVSDQLAELVCSNSLRSNELTSGIGLLKQEMRELGSAFMAVADACRVPAGKALAVDREQFAARLTGAVLAHPGISLHREQVSDPDALAACVVLAAGPLMAEGLAHWLQGAMGGGGLYFYDAIAPIVSAESLDMSIVFRGSRYQEPGEADSGDYLNCPFNREEYLAFWRALLEAEKVAPRDFERERHFEGCMPIEALAERGERTLTFGPLKPVGFTDPRTGHRPWAIVQLRAENRNASAFNLVGCQTKLTHAAQDAVFRRIPGLERAEFVRYGSMHRNTYVNAPRVLDAGLRLRARPHVRLAGQITGVEGYVESAASGLWLALLLVAEARGLTLPPPPLTTALGGLLGHLYNDVKHFQPSNAHFGLLPELGEAARKKERKALYSQRARADFAAWLASLPDGLILPPLPV